MGIFLDRPAFGELVSSHECSVFNYCARVVVSRETAAVATKAAFLALLREPFGEERSGSRLFQLLLASASDESAALTEAMSHEPEPADSGLRLRDANGHLAVRHREVLALRDLLGCSYEEIAAIAGADRGDVADLLWRARLGLHDELADSRLTSIAGVAEPCRHALPLIAMNWDGEATAPEEQKWLQGHLRTCGKCRSSQAAMRKASVSYRAWPAGPAPLGMRESLMVSADELVANAPARGPAA